MSSIKSIAVFPQITYSQGQGRIGTRKWVVEGNESYLENFLERLCKGHWPKNPNTVPTMIQVGAFDEKLKFCGGGRDLESLPHYQQTLVVAQYQFQFLNLEKPLWPEHIKKVDHPDDTTLSLRIRGSGQFITMPPHSLRAQTEDKQIGFSVYDNCRIVIPITEYHLTCDRLLPDKVPTDWKQFEGAVNSTLFMGERPGTLLFDTWELDHSFVPDVHEHKSRRFKLTCCLRSRDIPLTKVKDDLSVEGRDYVGWNYDYHDTQWQRIMVETGSKAAGNYKLRARYMPKVFRQMFISGDPVSLARRAARRSRPANSSGSGSGNEDV